MIWLGRLFTYPLGIIFFALLLVTVVLLEVNDTFLDPDFYPAQLREQEVFDFALGDLLTTFIDEARAKDADFYGLEENPFTTASLTTEQIVSSVRRAVPPEYLYGLVEQSFDQIGKYVTAERDDFTVTYRAGERAEALVGEVKTILREADAYDLLYEEVVTPAVDLVVPTELGGSCEREECLPLGVEVGTARLMQVVESVASPAWVRLQVENALDALTPYMLGVTDDFTIRVSLDDRVDIALDEVRKLAAEIDVYELLYSEVIEPRLADAIGQGVTLPFDLTLTDDEIYDALRRTASPEWVKEQAEKIVDDVSPYVTEEDSFSTLVSLKDNKAQARDVIVELVDERIKETLAERLPECTTGQLRAAAAAVQERRLPECLPAQFEVSELIQRLGVNASDLVTSLVLAPMPDEIRFTDTQLRLAITLAEAGAGERALISAEEILELIDAVREILRDGFTDTDTDFRAGMIPFSDVVYDSPTELVDQIRDFLSDGFTYSGAEFRARSPIFEFKPPSDAVTGVDQVRDGFALARTYRWVIWLPVLLLLVIIGFLGGRGWAGRVAYAAVFLMIGSGIILIATGPVYQELGKETIEEGRKLAIEEASDSAVVFPRTAALATHKVFDVGVAIADGFTGGVATTSRNLFIIGVVAFGAAMFWTALVALFNQLLASGKRTPGPATEAEPPAVAMEEPHPLDDAPQETEPPADAPQEPEPPAADDQQGEQGAQR